MNEHILDYYLYLLELNKDYAQSLILLDKVWAERRSCL